MPNSPLKPDLQTHTFRLPEPYNTQMKDKLRDRKLSVQAYIEALVMADPKTIRFNDADAPDRLEALEHAAKRCGSTVSAITRHLADAFIRYVAEHGHAPSYPVRIEPIGAPPGQSPRRRRR